MGRAEDMARKRAQQRDQDAVSREKRADEAREAELTDALHKARIVLGQLETLDYPDGELLTVSSVRTRRFGRPRVKTWERAAWLVYPIARTNGMAGDHVPSGVVLLSDGAYAEKRGPSASLIEDLPAFLPHYDHQKFVSGIRDLYGRYCTRPPSPQGPPETGLSRR